MIAHVQVNIKYLHNTMRCFYGSFQDSFAANTLYHRRSKMVKRCKLILDDGKFTKDHQTTCGIKHSKRYFPSFFKSTRGIVSLHPQTLIQ